MRLLRRWSLWALALGAIIAAIGPYFFKTLPEEAVAPPFVKPVWLAKDAPPSLHLKITEGHLERRLGIRAAVALFFKRRNTLRGAARGCADCVADPEGNDGALRRL